MFRKRERNASYEKILQKRNYFITGWDDDALYHTGTACHGTGESVYYMDTLKPVKSGQYTGNEGDSFVYTIGQHQYKGEIQTFMEIHIRMELKRG